MESHRAARVSEALREELGELIAYELSDPRIGDAVVTEVLVSPDMRHAQVRLHMTSDPSRAKRDDCRARRRAPFPASSTGRTAEPFSDTRTAFRTRCETGDQRTSRSVNEARAARPAARSGRTT